MINKKLFALTLVASSVIAAGCSSDDDDDDPNEDNIPGTVAPDFEDETSDAVTAGPDATDVNGDGSLNDDDDLNGDNIIDRNDVDLFDSQNPDGTETDPDANVQPAEIGETSITAAVRESEDFTQLSMDIDAAGLDGTLGDDNGTFTVFAPNNNAYDAFDADNPGVTDGFRANPDDGNLANVLTYHVLPTRETIESLKEMLEDSDGDGSIIGETVEIETVQGDSVTISAIDNDDDEALVGDDLLTINDIPVVAENTDPSNGNVLVLNSGLLVPTTPPAPTTGGEEDPEGTGAVGTGGGETGPVEGAVASSGAYSEFLDVFRNTLGGPSLDDPANVWTVIAPNNDGLDDDSDIDIQDYVVVGTKFEPDAFSGDVAANSGNTFSVSGSGTGGDLQIDGNDASVIAESDTLIVYGIDGALGDD